MGAFFGLYRVWIYAAIIAAVLGWGTYEWHSIKTGYIEQGRSEQLKLDQAEVDKKAAEAQKILIAETAKAKEETKTLQDLKDKLEIKNVENTAALAGLERRLRILAGPAGQLRDPNAGKCGVSSPLTKAGDTTTASSSGSDAAQTDGLLSTELTELLLSQASEADNVNNAYAACKPYAQKLRDVLQ